MKSDASAFDGLETFCDAGHLARASYGMEIVMFAQVTLSLFEGFVMTLKIFILTLSMALPLGLLICFGSMTKIRPLRWLIRVFIWIIRGTPLMLQLIVIYYGPGLVAAWAASYAENSFFAWIASWTVPERFAAVIIAFVINYSCYFSEIYRGGIEAIPRGQYEAGQVLGMTRIQTFFRVVLLQVVKHIVPPMSNEIITLVKDTSLARIIMVYEIIWNAQKFIKSDGLLWPLFYTGVYYLLFCGLLTLIFRYIENRLDYFE